MGLYGVRREQCSRGIEAHAAIAGCPSPPLTAIVQGAGAWTVVTIVGEVDLRVIPLVRGLVGPDVRNLLFDLQDVTFMDASGLDLLIGSQRRALAAGGCMRLAAPSRPVRRLLMLTSMSRMFSTFASVDEAIVTPLAPLCISPTPSQECLPRGSEPAPPGGVGDLNPEPRPTPVQSPVAGGWGGLHRRRISPMSPLPVTSAFRPWHGHDVMPQHSDRRPLSTRHHTHAPPRYSKEADRDHRRGVHVLRA